MVTGQGRQAAVMALHRVLQVIAEEMDRDCPVNQPLAFLKVAQAGEIGVDQGKLQDEMELSSAGISRLVQALSRVSYQKDREGFDLVERVFDPADNRRRSLKLTAKGERVIGKLIDAIGGKR